MWGGQRRSTAQLPQKPKYLLTLWGIVITLSIFRWQGRTKCQKITVRRAPQLNMIESGRYEIFSLDMIKCNAVSKQVKVKRRKRGAYRN